MDEPFEIITVDADNVDRHRFFCYLSKRKAPGYDQKCAWLAKKDIFLKHGFEEVAQAPPSFRLLAYRFDDAAPLPTFPTDWDARQARFGAGLTVVRTPQCPYIEDATNIALELASEKGIPSQVVTFQSAQELQEDSPSPYGVFGIVLDGQLIPYHYLQRKDFDKLAPHSP
jgi:hypothetical protein